MINFSYDVNTKKLSVKVQNKDGLTNPMTIIKVEDTTNEGILKTCQEWLDVFGLVDAEYHVFVQLH